MAPALDLTGPPYPYIGNVPHEVKAPIVMKVVNTPREGWPQFTTYHLGTNWPVYNPAGPSEEDLAPTLAAAGILVWRWPGGAASNFWCPSFKGEKWDQCFDDFPILKMAKDYIPQGSALFPTSREISHMENFITICKRSDCIPLVTINSGIALRYGPAKCVEFYSKVIRAFHTGGVRLDHFEFGASQHAARERGVCGAGSVHVCAVHSAARALALLTARTNTLSPTANLEAYIERVCVCVCVHSPNHNFVARAPPRAPPAARIRQRDVWLVGCAVRLRRLPL
jgi:hypothetical protein